MGTWTLPTTKWQAKRLAKIMAQPLPCKHATDRLRYIIGDDDLYDWFYEYDDDEDVRLPIARRLADWLEHPETILVDWSAESRRICEAIAKRYWYEGM